MKAINVKLDPSEVFMSAAREVTMSQILDDAASWLTEKEEERMMDEETGEVSTHALVAYLVAKGYWRLRALADDNARKARKEAPTHVYRARLGDVSKEAQARIDAARIEAAKLAGIVLPEPPVKPAKKEVPALDLSDAVAQTLAAPIVQAAAKPARKPAKVKAAPVQAPAPVEVKVIPEGVSGKRTRKAKPAPVAAAPVVQAPAPVVQAAAPVVVKAATSSGPAVKVGEYQLTDVVAWLRADLSRSAADAQRHFAALARNRAVNCYNTARA